MLIRVETRILERTEDMVLQGLEPGLVFIWGIKYIRHENIDYYESLNKNKTLIYLYDGSVLVVKEHVDVFHERLQELIKKEPPEQEEIEDEIILNVSDKEDDEEEI